MSAKEEKTGLYALKPGDRVQVFDVNGSRRGQPRGGWDGTVVKVGRTLIHVEYPGSYNRTVAFRMDNGGRSNDDYGHQSIKTVEEAAESLRRADVVARLRAGGIEIAHHMRIEHSTQTLEALAAVLDAADETTKD